MRALISCTFSPYRNVCFLDAHSAHDLDAQEMEAISDPSFSVRLQHCRVPTLLPHLLAVTTALRMSNQQPTKDEGMGALVEVGALVVADMLHFYNILAKPLPDWIEQLA